MIVINALDALNLIVFACKGHLLNVPDQLLFDRLMFLESRHSLALRSTAQSILQLRHSNSAAEK